MEKYGCILLYDKAPIKDKDLFNSIVSGLVPFGGLFGNVLSGFLQNKGRRLTMILISWLFTISVGVSMIFDMYALFIARFLMGIAVGGYTTTVPLIISEISPITLLGMLSSFIQIQANLGSTIAFIFAFAAPYSDDSDMKTNGNWRLIFAIPAIFSIIQLILFLVIFRYDTPKYYKIKGDEKNYHIIMSKLYQNYEKEPFNMDIIKPKESIDAQNTSNQLQLPEVENENQIYAQNEIAVAQSERIETNIPLEIEETRNSSVDKPKGKNSMLLLESINCLNVTCFFPSIYRN